MVHQVLNSYDGSLMDEFVLTKLSAWRFQLRYEGTQATSTGGGNGVTTLRLPGRRRGGAASLA